MANALTDLLSGNLRGFAENMGDMLQHPGRSVVQGPNGPQLSVSLLLDSDARNAGVKEKAKAAKNAERQADLDAYHQMMKIQDSVLGANPTLERQQEKMENVNAQLAGTDMARFMQRRDFSPEIAQRNAAREDIVGRGLTSDPLAQLLRIGQLGDIGKSEAISTAGALQTRETGRIASGRTRETQRLQQVGIRKTQKIAFERGADDAKSFVGVLVQGMTPQELATPLGRAMTAAADPSVPASPVHTDLLDTFRAVQPRISLEGAVPTAETDPVLIRQLKTKVGEGRELITNLKGIRTGFKREYLTFAGKAQGFAERTLDKFLNIDPGDDSFLAEQRAFFTEAQQEALKYRKFITGVAGGEKEFEQIFRGFPNPDGDSPREFLSKLSATIRVSQRVNAEVTRQLVSGIVLGVEERQKMVLDAMDQEGLTNESRPDRRAEADLPTVPDAALAGMSYAEFKEKTADERAAILSGGGK